MISNLEDAGMDIDEDLMLRQPRLQVRPPGPMTEAEHQAQLVQYQAWIRNMQDMVERLDNDDKYLVQFSNKRAYAFQVCGMERSGQLHDLKIVGDVAKAKIFFPDRDGEFTREFEITYHLCDFNEDADESQCESEDW